MSSAKLAFLRRASWECTSRRPGVPLAVCTHTGTEPSALCLTRTPVYICSGPVIFIQKGRKNSIDMTDNLTGTVFKTMMFPAQKKDSLPSQTWRIYIWNCSWSLAKPDQCEEAKIWKCKLLMLPGGGELNWREFKEVHDCWRSEAHRKGSTGVSTFITASAKLVQICTCKSRRSCKKHPSQRSRRNETHAAW